MTDDTNIERHACGAWIQRGEVCTACANAYGLCPLCGSNRRPQVSGAVAPTYCSDTCRKKAHQYGIGIPKDGVYDYKIQHGEWTQSASCASIDLDLWFPVGGQDADATRLALSICKTCPVKVECLLEGMQNKHGIWGGWTEEERKILANRLEKISSNIHKTVLAAAAKSGPAMLNTKEKQ